jgi:alkaline phosphatase
MFKLKNSLLLMAPLLLIAIITYLLLNQNSRLPALKTTSPWFQEGLVALKMASRREINNNPGAARNIILFIGDGMGISTVTAARIFAGQQEGLAGEEYRLSFENFPWTGLARTYNTNQQTPDSAGTMTAMMTGIKTRAGVININETVERANCTSYQNTQNANLMSALELAEIAGKSTGIVTTARLTHATPAAAYANTPERDWEASTRLDEDTPPNSCEDIASQFISFSERLRTTLGVQDELFDGIDLAFGGGRAMFFGEDPPNLTGFSEAIEEGQRKDSRNLIAEWISAGGIYVMDQSSFDQLDDQDGRNILGLFNASHMRYESDRANDPAGEPSLTEMTLKAIDILEEDEDGYFLVVEAGRIDHAHHNNNAFNALNETIELSRAVAAALNESDIEETLIIVTADHSHVMTMAGYPTRGNPILGKVITNDEAGNPLNTFALDSQEQPYTTLNYINGRGFADLGSRTDGSYPRLELDEGEEPPTLPGRVNINGIDTQAAGYHQEAFIPLYAGETHSGEDVPIYAIGPGSHLLSGSIEQQVIFHVMNHAGKLQELAEEVLQ